MAHKDTVEIGVKHTKDFRDFIAALEKASDAPGQVNRIARLEKKLETLRKRLSRALIAISQIKEQTEAKGAEDGTPNPNA